MPPNELEATEVSDYREEVILSLSTARRLAAESITMAQAKYKGIYDRKSQEVNYQLGDWVMVRFPQEETSKQRKLSRPWYGPYRVVERRDPDVTVVKVYAPQDGRQQVHQARVTPCPPELPSGFFWYGNRRARPGRPPKWVDRLLQGEFTATPMPEVVSLPPVEHMSSSKDPEFLIAGLGGSTADRDGGLDSLEGALGEGQNVEPEERMRERPQLSEDPKSTGDAEGSSPNGLQKTKGTASTTTQAKLRRKSWRSHASEPSPCTLPTTECSMALDPGLETSRLPKRQHLKYNLRGEIEPPRRL